MNASVTANDRTRSVEGSRRVGSASVPSTELARRDVVDLAWLAERLVTIAIGSLSLVVGAIVRAAVASGEARPTGSTRAARPDLGPLVAASAAVAVRSASLAARVGVNVVRASTDLTSELAGKVGARRLIREVGARLTAPGARGAVVVSAETSASAFADALVPRVVAAVADRIDVTEMILDRADLDRIVAAVDLDGVVAKLPIDEVVDRVDVDAVAARLDLDALIARLDLATIAAQVIEDIDLPELIREASGDLGDEAIDALRLKSMSADRRLIRWRDRLLSHGADGAGSTPQPGGTRS